MAGLLGGSPLVNAMLNAWAESYKDKRPPELDRLADLMVPPPPAPQPTPVIWTGASGTTYRLETTSLAPASTAGQASTSAARSRGWGNGGRLRRPNRGLRPAPQKGTRPA
jgi:hypothetical protein